MIEEDYVSFEVAKLLKEKGFDVDECEVHYDPLDHTQYEITLQMACKWLREVYNLHCSINYDFVLGWYCQITSLKETVEYDNLEMKHYHPDKDNSFSSSEEAVEAAIKYCLENLI